MFLDFDNTIIHGDAGPRFGWYLFRWRRHELEGRFWARLRLWARYIPFLSWMGVQAVLYRVGARRRSSIIRASYKGLRGVDARQFYGLMDDFAREDIVPRLYPEVVEAVRRHQAAGRRCVVVTTGIEALVRRVLDHVGPGI
ncbi:MAG TPA: HAD family hydrolase, partial [Candidatus Thermoplasmatota archaeon]|nr:HAD family hydrolase [Candidatus Thermoplasmatota archaeon]